MKIQFFRLLICADAYTYFLLIHIGKQRAHEPVPERKYCAVIRISLPDYNRVMYPVHGWRDKQNPEDGFKPIGDSDAAVMKLRAQYKRAFKYHHSGRACAQKEYKSYLDDGGKSELSDMEAGGGGYVHIKIAVVHPVKSPEKGYFMIQEMPDVEHEIHENDRRDNFDRGRQSEDVQNSHSVSLRVKSCPYNCGGKNKVNQGAVKQGK
jgi:hypothetical protein